ncbi:LPS export ABC transporter permease LptG [Tropicimonas sp. IMCC34011]|uniref:LPS export ABC transporter permease LptG n=1 Tax=Tropicimonas sp. IMCC34011 TaxID=2248759 RepID=UPI000E25AAD4|nr:LPS export ABC transporter permease LptG [Tropicimonas sp. IMCC34011]
MRLHLYFARRFATTFLGIFAVFAGLLALLDTVEQMRRFEGDDIGVGGALRLALLAMPESLYGMLPLVMILATLALFLGLARTSELVVIRASGRSAMRALIAPVLTAMVIGALGITVMNPIVAATKQQYELQAETLSGDGRQVLSVSREGLWLRQGGPEGQTVIRAARANLDGTELYGVTFLAFGPEGHPATRTEAASARLGLEGWTLTDAKTWPLDAANPERAAELVEVLDIPSTLTGDQIRDSFGDPSSIPIWELPAFIANLNDAGFSARSHRIWFQTELAMPLFLAAMVLIGAGFTMRHTRFGRTGLMVLFALLLGFGAFFIRNFANVLGENGQIPVALAVWAPPSAAVLLALGLIFHMEDG